LEYVKFESKAYIRLAKTLYFGVPVGIISGDKRLFEELENFDGEFVITKEGISYSSALLYHPEVLSKNLKAKPLPEKFSVEIEFSNIKMADLASIDPSVKRVDAYTLRFDENDFIRAFRRLKVLFNFRVWIIVSYYIPVVVTFKSHPYGSHLAHTHTMPPSYPPQNDIIPAFNDLKGA